LNGSGEFGFGRDPVSGKTLVSAQEIAIRADGVGAVFEARSFGGVPTEVWEKANGTESVPTAALSGDSLYQSQIRARDDAGFDFSGALVNVLASENWGASAHGYKWQLSTIANGATSSTVRQTIDDVGNVIIGATGTAGASAEKALHIENGVAPTGSITNGVILYSEDVAASAELKVRDEAGNVSVLSPHNFTQIPEGPSEDLAWSYYSERDGRGINIDMLRVVRKLEEITGEKFVYEFKR